MSPEYLSASILWSVAGLGIGYGLATMRRLHGKRESR